MYRLESVSRRSTMHDSLDLTTLLQLVAQKDQHAFAALYRLTSRHLMGVAYATLLERARAEDALQEAYLNVWRFAPSFNPAVAAPMTWLITIVRNKSRDALRSLSSQPVPESSLRGAQEPESAPEPAVDPRWHPDELLQSHIDYLEVNACMDKLKPGPRQALALAYYRNMAHAEVAESLNVPLGTAKAWIRRGLERLKCCLEQPTVGAS